MVGFCGVAGNPQHDIDDMISKLIYLGDEKCYNFSDSNIKFGSVVFKNNNKKQPVYSTDNSLIWLWGDVYGFDGPSGYISKKSDISDIEFCVRLYNKYNVNFVSGLNGVFAGVIYKPGKKVMLFSDRLGTHPIFYFKTKENELVFSTQIQSLTFYPSVNTFFDLNYLNHFFVYERVLGVKTVLKNVEKIHPGSILSYDLDKKKLIKNIYWCPRYDPKRRSFSDIVDDFSDLLRKIFEDKIDEKRTYGLYLSGGSDSRLILAVIKSIYPDINIVCFHLNDSMNREANIAKRVADTCGCTFKFLKRNLNYHEKVLELTSSFSIFQSWFDHSHFIGYKDEISKDVDSILHGNYSDTILKRHHLPKKTLRIPLLNEYIYLSSFLDVKSFDEHIKLYMSGQGSYCRDGSIPQYLEKIDKGDIFNSLKSEFKQIRKNVIFHGVKYPSFNDFIHWWSFYPLTNTKTYLVFYSEIQTFDSFTPFLDNRIIDFTLSLPDNFILKKSLINEVIEKINPSLSEIPHGGTNIPLKRSQILHSFYSQYDIAKCKLFPNQRWQGPWGDLGEIIRQYDFVKDRIYKNEKIIKNCEFLSWDGIIKSYTDHMNGKNNNNELFALLTFLENPITKLLLE